MGLAFEGDVITQRVASDIVMLKLGTGEYFGLDATGARMLDLLLLHRDRTHVVRLLLEEFDVDGARLEHDLGALVETLVARGLVKDDAPVR